MSLKRKISSMYRLARFERSFTLWQGLQSQALYQEISNLDFERVLILAPHPDDEALGCGGLVQRFSRSCEMDVVYLFSGAQSSISDKALLRRREAQLAKDAMGVREQYFLGFPDGTSVNALELKKIIEQNNYDAIICPNPVDPHADHAETAMILAKILSKHNALIQVWLYEIWNPLTYFNRLVKIDPVKKRELVKIYNSQLSDRDYVAAIEGLNTYRGEIMGVGHSAEVFMAIPGEVFAKMIKK